jgi:hypothetical protein
MLSPELVPVPLSIPQNRTDRLKRPAPERSWCVGSAYFTADRAPAPRCTGGGGCRPGDPGRVLGNWPWRDGECRGCFRLTMLSTPRPTHELGLSRSRQHPWRRCRDGRSCFRVPARVAAAVFGDASASCPFRISRAVRACRVTRVGGTPTSVGPTGAGGGVRSAPVRQHGARRPNRPAVSRRRRRARRGQVLWNLDGGVAHAVASRSSRVGKRAAMLSGRNRAAQPLSSGKKRMAV